jgi:hypothetical protein
VVVAVAQKLEFLGIEKEETPALSLLNRKRPELV